MGSFAYTCAVSGLPIHDGDKVRYSLLTRSPYNGEEECYIYGSWFPRTFPLHAQYNDYGSVDNVESGPFRQAWLDLFKLDLVERGWGDNSCHDVSTSKNDSFDHMLGALVEGRIKVLRDIPFETQYPDRAALGLEKDRYHKYEAEVGIPTIERISNILVAAGLTIFDGAHGSNAMMVDDDEGHGMIRVRVGDFSDKRDNLYICEEAIRKAGYAAVITRGAGNYADSAEIIVRPLPDTEGFFGRKKEERPPLDIGHIMIREDVWQALIKTRVDSEYKFDRLVIDDYKDGAVIAWNLLKNSKEKDHYILHLRQENGYVNVFLHDAVPCSVGLASAFKAMAKNNLTKSQVDEFLVTAAEFMFIQTVLSRVRYQWHPSRSSGPQFGEWDLHDKILTSFAAIARKEFDDEEEQKEEYEKNSIALQVLKKTKAKPKKVKVKPVTKTKKSRSISNKKTNKKVSRGR